MNFDKFNQFDTVKLTALYAALLKPRMIEEKMLKLLRQGQVSKWFSGIGQEAIAVGATLALEADEYIMPLHRNLGVFTARGIPFEKLLHQSPAPTWSQRAEQWLGAIRLSPRSWASAISYLCAWVRARVSALVCTVNIKPYNHDHPQARIT